MNDVTLPAEETPICDAHEQYLPIFSHGAAMKFVDASIAKRLEHERALAIKHLESLINDHDHGGYPLQYSRIEAVRLFIKAMRQ